MQTAMKCGKCSRSYEEMPPLTVGGKSWRARCSCPTTPITVIPITLDRGSTGGKIPTASATTMSQHASVINTKQTVASGITPCWPLVLKDIKAGLIPTPHPHLASDSAVRDAEGARKYGVHLRTQNGRNFLIDAYQEAADLTVYLRGALEELVEDKSPDTAYIAAIRRLYTTALQQYNELAWLVYGPA